MDSAALPSLTPLLDGIDRWNELAPLLPVLISLEIVLSADNAVALAAITRSLTSLELQKSALNVGISIALALRLILIFAAQYALSFWPLQFIAGIYLIFLFISKIRVNGFGSSTTNDSLSDKPTKDSFIKIVFLLALTDLAFSVDSVAAAVAISDQYLLVITGAIIGVIALRFTSGLFIKWLQIYSRLEMAGYIAVGLVGLKLIVLLLIPSLYVPEWLVMLIVGLLFIWGFSKRIDLVAD